MPHQDGSPPLLEVWLEFASTYSYPAVMRIEPLARAAGIRLRYRPFLHGPIFKAQGWETSPFRLYPAKGRYMWRDLERICAGLGLPFRPPAAFPANSVLAARVALVGLADDAGWGTAFCRAVYVAEYGEGRAIDDPTVMGEILISLGVDADATLEQAGTSEIRARLRAEIATAQQLGIFGAPSFVAPDGELFWGNDRLEQALAWVQGNALAAVPDQSRRGAVKNP